MYIVQIIHVNIVAVCKYIVTTGECAYMQTTVAIHELQLNITIVSHLYVFLSHM